MELIGKCGYLLHDWSFMFIESEGLIGISPEGMERSMIATFPAFSFPKESEQKHAGGDCLFFPFYALLRKSINWNASMVGRSHKIKVTQDFANLTRIIGS